MAQGQSMEMTTMHGLQVKGAAAQPGRHFQRHAVISLKPPHIPSADDDFAIQPAGQFFHETAIGRGILTAKAVIIVKDDQRLDGKERLKGVQDVQKGHRIGPSGYGDTQHRAHMDQSTAPHGIQGFFFERVKQSRHELQSGAGAWGRAS
jgi:hypothetical protein